MDHFKEEIFFDSCELPLIILRMKELQDKKKELEDEKKEMMKTIRANRENTTLVRRLEYRMYSRPNGINMTIQKIEDVIKISNDIILNSNTHELELEN